MAGRHRVAAGARRALPQTRRCHLGFYGARLAGPREGELLRTAECRSTTQGGTVRMKTTALPGGHVEVALSGEIDIVTAPEVRDALAGAASEAATGIVVDLGDVTFMDAAGLGALAGGAYRARHLPGGFRLVAVPPRVLRLLKVTGLDRHLAAFPVPPASPAPEPVSVGGAGVV